MHTFTPNTVTESAKVNANFAGLADGSEIADSAILPRHISPSLGAGWLPLGDTPDTVTYNGNRSYTLVFNTNDLTDTLSEGMRLKLTRTVSAPTQCTDLEASSSQYWNDTTVTGITFTDDFVVGAWVKLESYAASGQVIASRFNGTSGWEFRIDATTGQVTLMGYNAGGANYSLVQSYQSIPLGKWVFIAAQLDMSAFTATSTTSYIMIDGVDVPCLVSRAGTNPTALVQAGNLEIGSRNGGTTPFDGKLAQVFIASAKITQANVRTLYSQGLTAALISTHSIASAYSFSGNATDLNTTNANNLTAQNGAAATNVDSPFGNYLGGDLEYAVISTKPTFSTNTTVTVQVPEGCTIPTSGGVTTVNYSIGGTSYLFPRGKGRWSVQAIFRVLASQGAATISVWYNVGSAKLNVPVGDWDLKYTQSFLVNGAVSGSIQAQTSLSTTNNSESDPTFSGTINASSVNQVGSTVTAIRPVTTTTATDYYQVSSFSQNTGGGAVSLFSLNNTGAQVIEAAFGLI